MRLCHVKSQSKINALNTLVHMLPRKKHIITDVFITDQTKAWITDTNTCTRAHAHARTHLHTHTHAHLKNIHGTTTVSQFMLAGASNHARASVLQPKPHKRKAFAPYIEESQSIHIL